MDDRESCAAWRALAESGAALSRDELTQWARACDRERAAIDREIAECERLPRTSLAQFKAEERIAERLRQSAENVRLLNARLQTLCDEQQPQIATARAEAAAARARFYTMIAEASQRLAALGVKVPRS